MTLTIGFEPMIFRLTAERPTAELSENVEGPRGISSALTFPLHPLLTNRGESLLKLRVGLEPTSLD